jgi:hypothetical protein
LCKISNVLQRRVNSLESAFLENIDTKLTAIVLLTDYFTEYMKYIKAREGRHVDPA